jgi:hypothetical protein
MHKVLVFVINVLLVTIVNCQFQPPLNNFGVKDEKLKAEKQQKFPPCKSCTIFIESFNKVNQNIALSEPYLIDQSFQGLRENATWKAWRWRCRLGGEEAGKLQDQRSEVG